MTDELEWRNWQTHETQNLALRKQRGGSTPPSSTNISLDLDQLFFRSRGSSRGLVRVAVLVGPTASRSIASRRCEGAKCEYRTVIAMVLRQFAGFLAKVSPDNKPAVVAWLREHGLLNDRAERKRVAEYIYTDAEGHPVGKVVRWSPKACHQERPDGKGGWELKSIT